MDIYSVDFFIAIFIDLIITILGYCTIPIILRITKGKMEYKKGHKIILINCAIVWLIFAIIKIENGLDAKSGAVILYYFIDKAILLKSKEDKEENNKIVEKDKLDQELYKALGEDIKIPNEIEEKAQDSRSNNKTFPYILISILVVIIIGISICAMNLYNENKELKTETTTITVNNNNEIKTNKRLSKIEFESEVEKFESKAVEIWVSGTYEDTIYDEIIILEDVAYRFCRMGLKSPICEYYEINFVRNYNNDVVVSYDNVTFEGKIKGNVLELYMDDGRIYADFIKK